MEYCIHPILELKKVESYLCAKNDTLLNVLKMFTQSLLALNLNSFSIIYLTIFHLGCSTSRYIITHQVLILYIWALYCFSFKAKTRSAPGNTKLTCAGSASRSGRLISNSKESLTGSGSSSLCSCVVGASLEYSDADSLVDSPLEESEAPLDSFQASPSDSLLSELVPVLSAAAFSRERLRGAREGIMEGAREVERENDDDDDDDDTATTGLF